MNYVVSKHVRTVFSCSYLKTINTYKCTCKQVVPNIKLRCFVTRPVSNEPSHIPFLALSNIAYMSDLTEKPMNYVVRIREVAGASVQQQEVGGMYYSSDCVELICSSPRTWGAASGCSPHQLDSSSTAAN